MTLSIIIPIYNCGKYLDGLFQSLLPLGSDSDFEFIFVNDGSTDDSAEIIQQYLPKFKNTKYIYQENQGSSYARNAGIATATGDYIWYIDGDDEIDAQKVYELKKQMDSAPDIVEFQYDTIDLGGVKRQLSKPASMTLLLM
jgi:glycosyltransferase involved in cell wall biosynthesis